MNPFVRVLRWGVRADTPQRDVRFIIVVNAGAALAALAIVPYAFFMWSHHGLEVAAATFAQVPVLAATLWFNARGRHRTAVALLFIVAALAPAIQTVAFGMEAGHYFFFLVLMAGAPLAVPRRMHILLLPIMVAALGLFMAVMVYGPSLVPRVRLDPGQLRPVFLIISFGSAMILGLVSLTARRVAVLAENKAAREHARSEQLLQNMLPAAVAAQLKAQPHEQIASRFDDVAVLFADIVGFSAESARTPPTEVVARLNAIFSAFDDLAVRHGVEKIKTIGDSYMAAAGVPERTAHPVRQIADLALDMLEAAERLPAMQGGVLSLRVGLHVGPVVAGVIGKQKPAYDLWGDTVNVASRLESTGLPGRIQISRGVAERLAEGFVVERRGDIDAKGVGRLDAYLLLGRRRAPRTTNDG